MDNEIKSVSWDGKPKSLPVHINHRETAVEATPMVNAENNKQEEVIQVHVVNPIRQKFRVILLLILCILAIVTIGIYASKFQKARADAANPYRNGSIFQVDRTSGRMAGIKESFKNSMTFDDFANTVEAYYDAYNESYQKLLDKGMDPLLARQEAYEQFKALTTDIAILYKEKFPSYQFDERFNEIMQGYVEPKKKGWFS